MTDNRSRPPSGSDFPASPAQDPERLPRPRKRPVQARSKFTVRALYDAYVRIWRRDGPEAVTMRAVAAESGFAVGTLYEYFPNQAALHSGYVRHVLDDLNERIAAQTRESYGREWRERLSDLVTITCGQDEDAPYFDAAMQALHPST